MWRECSTGDFTIATNALAREYVRHEGKGMSTSYLWSDIWIMMFITSRSLSAGLDVACTELQRHY
jgi:hypothetical protein